MGQYPPGAALVEGSARATPGDMDGTGPGPNRGGRARSRSRSAAVAATPRPAHDRRRRRGARHRVPRSCDQRRTAVVGGLVFASPRPCGGPSSSSWTHGPACCPWPSARGRCSETGDAHGGLASATPSSRAPPGHHRRRRRGGLAVRRRTLAPGSCCSAPLGDRPLAIVALQHEHLAGAVHLRRVRRRGSRSSSPTRTSAGSCPTCGAASSIPTHGLLIWAPFVIVLGIGAVVGRRQVADWSATAAVGGVLYLLVQSRAEHLRRRGGATSAYRYPLEHARRAAARRSSWATSDGSTRASPRNVCCS